MNGFLLVDKPAGPTSHDVVARARRILGEKRCGHTGTLDPFATGLLILCMGRATRLARFLTDTFKSYEATIRFGFATDTYDRTGTPVGEVLDAAPERAELARALDGFRGRQTQRPPAYSAKKRAGKRLYELARQGTPVEAVPVEVEIRALELVDVDGANATIRVTVSSGTYIRSLAHDIGERLGTGAHLHELRRTAIGSFSVVDAVALDAIEAPGKSRSWLTVNQALRDLDAVTVGEDAARRLAHGHAPAWKDLVERREWDGDPAPVRVVDPAGELLCVGEPGAHGIRPLVVWAESSKPPKS